MSWWATQSAKYKDLLAEYGVMAAVVWFSIFLLTLGGFWAAINAGVEVQGTTGSVGKLGAAYAATQLTKPVRIGATLVLTPIAAKLKHRVMGTVSSGPTAPPAPPKR